MVWILLLVLLAAPGFPLEAAEPKLSAALEAAQKQDFKTADLVFRATIAAITLADIGPGQAAAPVVMFSFEDMEILKGEKPGWSSFIFEHLPESAAFSKGGRVLVFLKKTGGGEEFRISGMTKLPRETRAALEGSTEPAVNNP